MLFRNVLLASVAVGVTTIGVPSGAHAQSLTEMKSQLQLLQRRIEQLEAADRRKQQRSVQVQEDQETRVRVAQQKAEEASAQARDAQAKLASLPVAVASAPAPAEPVTRGTLPGSFLVPGTSTSVKIGGYVKVDAIYDLGAPQGDLVNPAAVPLNAPGAAGAAARRDTGNFRLHARQTRLSVATSTPSAYGPLTSLIEADFFGGGGGNSLNSNSYNFRLRHAYAEIGPVGFGQYWSLFEDTRAAAENLDFNGPTGQIFLRQPQIRYVHKTKDYGTFGVSVESPEPDFFGSANGTGGAVNTNGINRGPDVVAKYEIDHKYGHVFFAGVGRFGQIDTGLAGTSRPTTFGYGVSAQGSIENFYGKDRFVFTLAGGDGIGRYLLDNGSNAGVGQGSSALTTGLGTTTPNAAIQSSIGGHAGYQHWWTDTVRSNVIYGRQQNQVDRRVGGPTSAFVAPGLNRSLQTVHVNLIWSPVPRGNIGIEYINAKRTTNTGLSGESNRLQMALQYGF